MKRFNEYASNTLAGTSNQLFFGSDLKVARAFYKAFVGGENTYSLMFSNIIDSTYANGAISSKNIVLNPWEILSLKVAVLDKNTIQGAPESDNIAEYVNSLPLDFKPVTFDGKNQKSVAPGEFFMSDDFVISPKENDYICIEITCSGDKMPYHEEAIIPIYSKEGDTWKFSKKMPLPSMVGIKRSAKLKIGFIGDSITQGIGVANNSYAHWNNIVARGLGNEYAFWNLGIGFGRASDIASLGAWMFKAIQNDLLVVCYGVNDIMQGASAERVKNDLLITVDYLLKQGKRVVLQTVPPFNYNEEQKTRWLEVNRYIKEELAQKVELVFDVVPYLALDSDHPEIAKFGGHPNECGSKIWGEALLCALNNIL